MGWAKNYIDKLKSGEPVQFEPRGQSMSGRIESGQLVIIWPLSDEDNIAIGDVVLCRVHGNEYLHLVISESDGRYLIGNNRGGINGWTHRSNIFGRMVE